MINTYISAKLINYKTIRVFIFSEVKKPEYTQINLIKNDEEIFNLKVSKQSFINGLELYEFNLDEPIVLGNDYYISIESFGVTSLNVNDATSFDDFDKDYFYNGDDLGFTYSKEKTTWKLWAPLASKVVLFVKNDDKFETYKMKRGEKGVYEITLNGDYELAKYRYSICNSGLTTITTDPYAKASSANGKDSIVIDFSKTKIDLYEENLPKYKNYVDTIIYELSVRDFTIDDSTDIVNKGKFLGLIEENRKTKKKNQAGFDYLKSLGVTHVQLLPIYDFKTTDELNPSNTYNWGYDPHQYFVPEGSYATDPEDGYTRIIECKKMISALHKNGIKVNMDVVYNHVYNFNRSVFESVVPNYYFRKDRNGMISNGSGCGNELDTCRPMVRKLIVDSAIHWIQEYGIDGFRLDLMGLIDIDTIEEIKDKARLIKDDFMIYGEGWNMDSPLHQNQRTAILNSFKTPDIAFFNDSYRDIVRGPHGFNCNEPGYLLGNTSYREGFKFALLGSCVDYCFNRRFLTANQSINYVECHDNITLYDKITYTLPNLSEEEKNKIINSINCTIAISFGIPFYHAGQEIGLSKKGEDNTYNKGDEYNKFDWNLLDNRMNMVLYFKSIIKFRRTFNNIYDPNEISKFNKFINYDNGALGFKLDQIKNANIRDFLYLFNPNNFDINIRLNDYYNIIVALAGYLGMDSQFYTLNEILVSHQVEGLVKKEDAKVL